MISVYLGTEHAVGMTIQLHQVVRARTRSRPGIEFASHPPSTVYQQVKHNYFLRQFTIIVLWSLM
jgi:hypothetical protein